MCIELPNPVNHFYAAHLNLLLTSYETLLNKPWVASYGEISPEQIYHADFALLSHNAEQDPLFNYANCTAQTLFELTWDEFIGMPSRLSAEALLREERERVLARVAASGYISDYSGVRIAKSGKRFLIKQAVVWNVFDRQGAYYGQAACFSEWTNLP